MYIDETVADEEVNDLVYLLVGIIPLAILMAGLMSMKKNDSEEEIIPEQVPQQVVVNVPQVENNPQVLQLWRAWSQQGNMPKEWLS